MSWVRTIQRPEAPVGNSLGALPLRSDGPPLFVVNAEASAEDLLEFADVGLDTLNNSLTAGIQGGLGVDECWQLQTTLALARAAIRAAVGQP